MSFIKQLIRKRDVFDSEKTRYSLRPEKIISFLDDLEKIFAIERNIRTKKGVFREPIAGLYVPVMSYQEFYYSDFADYGSSMEPLSSIMETFDYFQRYRQKEDFHGKTVYLRCERTKKSYTGSKVIDLGHIEMNELGTSLDLIINQWSELLINPDKIVFTASKYIIPYSELFSKTFRI